MFQEGCFLLFFLSFFLLFFTLYIFCWTLTEGFCYQRGRRNHLSGTSQTQSGQTMSWRLAVSYFFSSPPPISFHHSLHAICQQLAFVKLLVGPLQKRRPSAKNCDQDDNLCVRCADALGWAHGRVMKTSSNHTPATSGRGLQHLLSRPHGRDFAPLGFGGYKVTCGLSTNSSVVLKQIFDRLLSVALLSC